MGKNAAPEAFAFLLAKNLYKPEKWVLWHLLVPVERHHTPPYPAAHLGFQEAGSGVWFIAHIHRQVDDVQAKIAGKGNCCAKYGAQLCRETFKVEHYIACVEKSLDMLKRVGANAGRVVDKVKCGLDP